MTLREFMNFVCACAEQSGHSFSEDFAEELARQIVREHPAEYVYIPRPVKSTTADIIAAARRMPNAEVAKRYGVSRYWVNKVSKRSE